MANAPTRERATYEDVLSAPPNMVAEVLDGELHLMPRPRRAHLLPASGLGAFLFTAFHPRLKPLKDPLPSRSCASIPRTPTRIAALAIACALSAACGSTGDGTPETPAPHASSTTSANSTASTPSGSPASGTIGSRSGSSGATSPNSNSGPALGDAGPDAAGSIPCGSSTCGSGEMCVTPCQLCEAACALPVGDGGCPDGSSHGCAGEYSSCTIPCGPQPEPFCQSPGPGMSWLPWGCNGRYCNETCA